MAVALHLRGRYTPPVGVVNLHVVATDDSRTAHIFARSASPRLAARIYHAHIWQITARTSPPRVITRANYDPNLLSHIIAVTRAPWSDGAKRSTAHRLPFGDGGRVSGVALPRWSDATPARNGPETRWSAAARANGTARPSWSDATPARGATETVWQQAARANGGAETRWKDAPRDVNSAHVAWFQLARLTNPVSTRWQDGGRLNRPIAVPFGDGARARTTWRTTWNDAGYPLHRSRPRPPIPPEPWEPIGTHICLRHPLPGALLHLGWGCQDLTQTIIVPIRRIYRVFNTVTLTRVTDGAVIPADGLSLSLDADSWAWSWSARVPGSAVTLLMPDGDPQDLLATVNGHGIRLLIDSISRAREFGSSWLSVRGRGRAAVLAAPTAASRTRYNSETRSAQQLMEEALTDNGVPIGWTVDWGIEDWSVPAGSWSHTGTDIEAATRIAEAGGGYIQGHDTAQTLLVLPYYPAAPWAWPETTPDYALPEDACQTEGIEWIEKAAYNAVWITGNDNGRRDYIRRTGTDGLTMAQTIVDGLATDAVMTRQRGLRVLADTGKQALITVKLPVLAETGIIKPGNLVEYTENGIARRGMSRAVSLDCGFPEVWQTIKLEARE